MREILFRGKRVYNGKWVYGYLIEQNTPEYHCYIVVSFKAEQDNRHTDIYECDIHEVIPETVGQYTGVTDKNGVKIFEGDIVREFGGETYQGCYEIDNVLIVKIPDMLLNFVIGYDCEREIIGNIHDNPELLEDYQGG